MNNAVWAWYYIAFFGLLLPYAAVKQTYVKPRERPERSLLQKHLSILTTLALFGLIGLGVAYRLDIPIFVPWTITPLEIAVGLAMLVLFYFARRLMRDWLRVGTPQPVVKLQPETWKQFPTWGLISLCAGFFEEICYRWLLSGLLGYYLHSMLLGALLSAVAFALAHARQGWRSMGFIFVFAIAAQILVNEAGTLYTMMIVHAVYDLLVGIESIREKALAPTTEPG